MSLFRRSEPERRSLSFQDLFAQGAELTTSRTKSGQVVNWQTALGLSATWAAVKLLSDSVAQLPVEVYLGEGVSRTEVQEQPRIVSSPSVLVGRRDWVHQSMTSLLLWGNAYGRVLARDEQMLPSWVEWYAPNDVSVDQPQTLSLPRYHYEGVPVDLSDVLHVRGMMRPGRVVGLSPLMSMQETFGLGLAAQRYAAEFFGSGGHPTGILQAAGDVTEDTARIAKSRFLAGAKGREPVVLGNSWKYDRVQTTPSESQFLEAQERVVQDVARAFTIPPEMIGTSSGGTKSLTYANREQRALDFVTFSVVPWLTRLEDAWSSLLPSGQYVKFDTSALLRSDMKGRYDAYAVAIDSGVLSVDEVRAHENLKPRNQQEDPDES